MRSQEEHEIQKVIVEYLDIMGAPYFAIPNGGQRHPGVARKLKAEGVKAGVADLFIMHPNANRNGLFVEVKTAIGKQSESQKDFQSKCKLWNYAYVLVRSLDDMIEILDDYKNNKI